MKHIHNSRSGHEYRLLRTGFDTNGEVLDMEVQFSPATSAPPAHYHPRQTEHFRVLSGEITVRVGTRVQVLRSGDSLVVPPNTEHAMWNAGRHRALLQWTVRPALQTEQLYEALAELANQGQTDERGVPGLLQGALMLMRFAREFRLATPPFPVQVLLFGLLAPFALLGGHRPSRLRSHAHPQWR